VPLESGRFLQRRLGVREVFPCHLGGIPRRPPTATMLRVGFGECAHRVGLVWRLHIPKVAELPRARRLLNRVKAIANRIAGALH
jgi:hypothetical protein